MNIAIGIAIIVTGVVASAALNAHDRPAVGNITAFVGGFAGVQFIIAGAQA